ncbi:hypothetical protein EDB80DRAFT_874896 [Ilyonectria destructans]|nr:hypothetical protein EDB80DRAFT_874896 [Ilyonectria destructans]
MNAHPDASRGAQSTTNGKMTRLAMKPSSVNTVGPILPIVETGEPPRKRPRVNDPIIIAADVSKATLKALQLYKTMPLMPLKIADGRIHFFIPTIRNQPSSDEWILSGYCSNSEGLHFTFDITDDLWQAADNIMEVHLDTKGDSRRTTDIDKQANSIIWILRYISSCVRIVLGVLPSKKQRQWNNRARMVNRIVNRLGLRGLGLPYAYALANCKFATIMDMSEGIRDQVADLVARDLLGKDLNMRDDVGLLCMAALIRSILQKKILQQEMSYEDICKHIHLPNFVNKPIELPFARLEHIKAKLNVPPEPDLDEVLGKDVEMLNSVPRISPLRAINGYEVFSTSADLQMKALDAGMCQRRSSDFHNVIADLYSYTWSRLHLAVYYQAWKDSVSPVTA